MLQYNTQTLLFSQSNFIFSKTEKINVSDDFYRKGFICLDGIGDEVKAHKTLEQFIASLDGQKLPIYQNLLPKIKLAKADKIPVCDDSITTNFQALHFDMGQPLLSSQVQNIYLIVGLYFSPSNLVSQAETRILSLRSILSDLRWGGAKEIENKIIDYISKYGDGWGELNTGRLQCFARIVDAVCGTADLKDYRDKRMAEWFQENGENGLSNELCFYNLHGFDSILENEQRINLKPGQLLIIDNARTVHGRLGQRNKGEIYQFMFGVENITPEEIDFFRKELIKELVLL